MAETLHHSHAKTQALQQHQGSGALPQQPAQSTWRHPTSAHEKTKAVRSAQRAVRPASAIAGLGERAGADISSHQQQHHGSNRGAGSLHAKRPASATAAAAAAAAAAALRPQFGGAASAAVAPPKDARDIFPQDVAHQGEPRFCTGCRGGHEHSKERNKSWQPYTPLQRFQNLYQLEETPFQVAFRHKILPALLNPDSRVQPVRWVMLTEEGLVLRPDRMTDEHYVKFLPLLLHGAREGHEPYRFLATQAALDMLATGSSSILAALPLLVAPMKLALNTLQPSLVGHMLLLLQRVLKSHPHAGRELVPHYSQLLPAMTLFKHCHQKLWLPPPHCLPATGSFSGDGRPPAGSPSCCPTCGGAFSNRPPAKPRPGSAQATMAADPTDALGELDREAKAAEVQRQGPLVHKRAIGSVIAPTRRLLSDVVAETLEVMAEAGGKQGLAAIKSCIPTFDYYDPKD